MANARFIPLLMMGLLVGAGFLTWALQQPACGHMETDAPGTLAGTRATGSLDTWLLYPPVIDNTGHAAQWNVTTVEDFEDGLMVNTQADTAGDGGVTLQPSKDFGPFTNKGQQILSMAYSRNSTVICGLASGEVCTFDPINETKSIIFDTNWLYPGEGNVSAMAVDIYDHLWGACYDSGRIFLYDLNDGDFYDFGQVSPLDGLVTAMSANEYGQVWAGTANEGFLYCIDATTYDTYLYEQFPSYSFSITTMSYASSSGTLFVGTGEPKDNTAPNPMAPHILMIDARANLTSTWPITDAGSYPGFKSITSLTSDRSHNIYFGVVPTGKFYNVNLDSGDSYIGNNPVGANAITAMHYSELSNTVFCGTNKEGRMFSFSPGPNTFSTLSDGFAGCSAVNCLVTPSDFFGLWGSQFPNGNLFKIVATGIWISPVLNATEPAIWDTVRLEYSQALGASVFGFMRFGANVYEVTHSDFNDSSVFFQTPANLDLPDCQYLQMALIFQTTNAFDPLMAPILRSVCVTLGYPVQMEIAQTCDHKEAVLNSNMNYTVFVNNTSHGLANAKVYLTVPNNAKMSSSTIPYETESTSVVLFRLSNVTQGAHVSFNYSLKVKDSIVTGSPDVSTQLRLNCTAIRDHYGPEVLSNAVTVQIKQPTVDIGFSLDKASASPGETVRGTIHVDVAGDIGIDGANVTMAFPAELELVNSSVAWGVTGQGAGSLAFWELGQIQRGSAVNISLTFELNMSAGDDVLFELRARINYTDGLGVNTYSLTSLRSQILVKAPALGFELFTEPAGLTFAQVGQTVPFKITYSNPGHGSAYNLTVKAEFTEISEYTSNPSLNAVTWSMPEVLPNTYDLALDFALRVRHGAPNGSAMVVNVTVQYQMYPGGAPKNVSVPPLALPVRKPFMTATVSQTDPEPGLRALGTASLKVGWENIGNGDCKELTLRMRVATLGVHVWGDEKRTQDEFKYVVVAAGDKGDHVFTLRAQKDVKVGQQANVEFEVECTDAFGNVFSTLELGMSLELRPRLLPAEPFVLKDISPADGAKDVAVSARFTARSDFAIDNDTLQGAVSVTPQVDMDVRIRNESKELYVKFPSGLKYGTTYTVMISSSLKDEYGRDLDRTYYCNFTTEKAEGSNPGKDVLSNGFCLIVAILIVIAVVVVVALVLRQKKMQVRIAELDAKAGRPEAEEPDIVYEPETSIEPAEEAPKVVRTTRPLTRAPAAVESSVTARPLGKGAQAINLASEPEPPARMPQVPGGEAPKDVTDEDDLDIDDPYNIHLDMLRSPGQRGSQPILSLPPAVIIDMDDITEETPYHIDEVLVMTKEGILVQHFTAKNATAIDEDILAGMLTAVQMFVKDTFGGQKDSTLDELSLGDFKIMIGRGDYITISIILSGESTKLVRPQLDAMIADTEKNLKDLLSTWNGDMSLVSPIREYIKKLVEGKYKKEEE